MLVYILYILTGFNTWFEFPEYGAKVPKRTGVLLNCTIMHMYVYFVCAGGWLNRRKQVTLQCAE